MARSRDLRPRPARRWPPRHSRRHASPRRDGRPPRPAGTTTAARSAAGAAPSAARSDSAAAAARHPTSRWPIQSRRKCTPSTLTSVLATRCPLPALEHRAVVADAVARRPQRLDDLSDALELAAHGRTASSRNRTRPRVGGHPEEILVHRDVVGRPGKVAAEQRSQRGRAEPREADAAVARDPEAGSVRREVAEAAQERPRGWARRSTPRCADRARASDRGSGRRAYRPANPGPATGAWRLGEARVDGRTRSRAAGQRDEQSPRGADPDRIARREDGVGRVGKARARRARRADESVTLAMPRAVPTVIRPLARRHRVHPAVGQAAAGDRQVDPSVARSRTARRRHRWPPRRRSLPRQIAIWVNGMPEAGGPCRVRKDLKSGSTRVSAASASCVRSVATQTPSGAPSRAPTTAEGRPKVSRSGMRRAIREDRARRRPRCQDTSPDCRSRARRRCTARSKVGVEQNLRGVGLQRGTAAKHFIHRGRRHRTRRRAAGRGDQAAARDDLPSAARAEKQSRHRIVRVECEVDDPVRHGPLSQNCSSGWKCTQPSGRTSQSELSSGSTSDGEDARQQRRVGRIVRALPLLELRMPDQQRARRGDVDPVERRGDRR